MPVLKTFDFEAMFRGKCKVTKGGKYVVFTEGGKIPKDYLTLIMAARQILEETRPMTVRQIYYQLFSQGFVKNSYNDYKLVVAAMVEGRQRKLIPWDWVEDRLRRPRTVNMWSGLPEFFETVKQAYRLDVWANQDNYVEVWVEKDALSGIFEDQLRDYGVTLNVGRGYDGWSSVKNAAARFKERKEEGKTISIAYFGDFDPSGEDMLRSLVERIGFFGVRPQAKKWAITREDIDEYDLPPEPGKHSDSRAAGFIAEHGELIQVELDALPVEVLKQRIREAVESHLDMDALQEVRDQQESDLEKIASVIDRSD